MDSEQAVEATAAWQKAGELILEWLQAGGAFAAEQAPHLATEALRWGLIEHTAWIVLNILVVVGGVCGLRFVWRNWKAIERGDLEPPAFIFGVMASGAALFAAVGFLHCAATIAKIYVTPRLYLIEYFAKLAGE